MALLRGGCVVCGSPRDAPLCDACWRQVDPPPSTRVRGVGPVPALFAYDGHGARVVQRLKYRDGRRLVGPLADGLADVLVLTRALPDAATVAWVPTSGRRRRERGFDQAELLARALSRRLGLPARCLLRREGGRHLTGLDRSERAAVADGVFSATRQPPPSVVLVDDVSTTGASLRAAVAALRAAGGQSIQCAVIARTP